MNLTLTLQVELTRTVRVNQVFSLPVEQRVNHVTVRVRSVYASTNNGFSDIRFMARTRELRLGLFWFLPGSLWFLPGSLWFCLGPSGSAWVPLVPVWVPLVPAWVPLVPAWVPLVHAWSLWFPAH